MTKLGVSPLLLGVARQRMLARDYGFRMRSTISGAPMSILTSILSVRRTHLAEIHLFEINFH